jgi:hypothetical protein
VIVDVDADVDDDVNGSFQQLLFRRAYRSTTPNTTKRHNTGISISISINTRSQQ